MLSLLQKPVYQLLTAQVLSLLTMLIYRPNDVNAVWTAVGLFYFLFIVVNSILVWPATSPWLYFFISIGLSIVYLIISWLVCAGTIRLLNLNGSGESSMVFLVIIYHPASIMFVMLIKWVYYKVF